MKNLVFLSGPQGAGKTTLVNLLRGPDIMVPDLETKTISINTHPEARAALKICQRSLENFEYLQIARQHPDKLVLGNRCIYDQYAFDEVFWKRGWINKETKEKYDEASRIFHIEELREPHAIVLNPDFSVVAKHLKKRWELEGKKWREGDSEYIRLACKVYETFRGRDKILYIDHEIDLTSLKDIGKIYQWLELPLLRADKVCLGDKCNGNKENTDKRICGRIA